METGQVKLYHGDCLELLNLTPDILKLQSGA